MGFVQAAALLAPLAFSRALPRVLLAWAVAYLLPHRGSTGGPKGNAHRRAGGTR